jgi:hypothetical protein
MSPVRLGTCDGTQEYNSVTKYRTGNIGLAKVLNLLRGKFNL